MYRTAQSTRAVVARVARQQYFAQQQRNFIRPTAALKADLVQDLYLKELKSFKQTPTKADDAKGSVHAFSPPKTPKSPEESNIANDLKAYESQTVEVEGRAAAGEAEEVVEDWFVDDIEEQEQAKH